MRFVGIMGATGVGKSAVAVQLALDIGGEIISADSMQVYKGMDIGTAKITPSEMQGIPHHMLDVVDIDCPFNAHMYASMTNNIIDEISSRGKVPIIVGGTGLYFYSLLYGLDHADSSDESTRDRLTQMYQDKGLSALIDMLHEVDPAALQAIDVHNYKRVMRAIEIALCGGSVTHNSVKTPICDAVLFVLGRERQIMYDNIDARVDSMIDNGLLDEVSRLYASYPDNMLQSLQAIGYKEIVAYLDDKCSLDSAIDSIKLNSRRYAKRQLSYFKRLPAVQITCDKLEVVQIVAKIAEQI